MANMRRKFQFQYSMQRDMVHVVMKAAIGAAGAPTLSTTDAFGVTSITRNSAGKYTILLQDNYPALVSAQAIILNSAASAAPITQLLSEQVVNATAPNVVVQCLGPAGAAADPDSGSTLFVHLIMRNVMNSTTS